MVDHSDELAVKRVSQGNKKTRFSLGESQCERTAVSKRAQACSDSGSAGALASCSPNSLESSA